MVRTWGPRLFWLIASAAGIFLVLALVLQVPGVARGLGAPENCATCHTMSTAYTAHASSAHSHLTCSECHVPNGFLSRPAEELRSSVAHATAFLTGPPDVIHSTARTAEITTANCKSCHAAALRNVRLGDRNCADCHRFTPHGQPTRSS